jgi:hypothetical protein
MKNNKYVYRYKIGDFVTVLPIEKISDGLQNNFKDGTLFMEEMYGFCDGTYKILKVVRNIFNEKTLKMYQPNAPIYILEDVNCSGQGLFENKNCDHSCFFFWHQDWLEKITK